MKLQTDKDTKEFHYHNSFSKHVLIFVLTCFKVTFSIKLRCVFSLLETCLLRLEILQSSLPKKPTHSAGPTLLYVHPDVEIYIEEINIS